MRKQAFGCITFLLLSISPAVAQEKVDAVSSANILPTWLKRATVKETPPASLEAGTSQTQNPALLRQETRSLHETADEIRDLRIKPEVQISKQDFFSRYAIDLKLRLDQNDQIKAYHTFTDKLGRIQTRHKQYYKGLEVIGAEYVLQEKAGSVDYAIGKLMTGLDLDIAPQLSEEQALSSAKCAKGMQACPWQSQPNSFTVSKMGLAVTSKGFTLKKENARLVWRFSISRQSTRESDIWEIDANTAEVVNRISQIYYGNDPPLEGENVSCSGLSRYDGMVQFTGLKDSANLYNLNCKKSTECPAQIEIIDERNPNPQGGDPAEPSFCINSANNTTFSDPEDDVGVSVSYGLQKTMQYFVQKFNWLGFDGLGQVPIFAFLSNNPENNFAAKYTKDGMIFDMGHVDGTKVQGAGVNPEAVAHEFTHGIIVRGGDYANFLPSHEGAALNEGFAFIFGELVEGFARGQADWLLGNEVTSGQWYRNFGNPKASIPPRPDTYKGLYYSGCTDEAPCKEHDTGVVFAHWFYLLFNGGTGTNDLQNNYNVSGIGLANAEQILFRTMTTKFLVTSNFYDVRLGTIAAVEELFEGKPELDFVKEQVTNAWYAVGVGEEANSDDFRPPSGSVNVFPWPVTLVIKSKPPYGQNYQVQISTSSIFAKDLQSQDAGGQMCPASGPEPLVSSEAPPQTRDTPTVAGRSSSSEPGCNVESQVQFDLKPNTQYFWRVRSNAPPTTASQNPLSSAVREKGTLSQAPDPTLGSVAGGQWSAWSSVRDFKTDLRMPVLIYPKGENSIYPWGTQFKWEEVDGAKNYWLQISEDPGLSQGSIGQIMIDPTKPANREGSTNRLKHTLSEPLRISHTYYWGVFPYGPKNIEGNWSNNGQGQIFKTTIPQTTKKSPSTGTTLSPFNIPLVWEKTSGAIGYVLKVYRENNQSENLYKGSDPTGETVEVTIPPDPELQGSTTEKIYWTVAPKGPPPLNELGTFSSPWYLTIDWGWTKPTLLGPADGSDVAYKKPSHGFSWTMVPEATKYEFYLYRKNSDGTCETLLSTQEAAADHLDFQKKAVVFTGLNPAEDTSPRCWRVAAVGPNNALGMPSDFFTLNVGGDAVTPISPASQATNVEYSSTQFSWSNNYAPYGFQIVVYEAATNSIIINQKLSAKTFSANLKPGTQYKWNVGSLGASGTRTAVSSNLYFTTKAATCPTVSAPAIISPLGINDGYGSQEFVVNGLTYTLPLKWGSVSGASQYEVTLFRYAGYPTTKLVENQSSYSGTTSNPMLIYCGYDYSWAVRAKNSCGNSSSLKESGRFFCQKY